MVDTAAAAPYNEPMVERAKKLVSKLSSVQLSRRAFLLLCAAAVLLRLLVLAPQNMTLYPETSMLDDKLMIEVAKNVAAGQWLGSYNYLTLGKHMLFALWLALLNLLGIPYLLAGQLLYSASAFAAVQSAAPALRNRLVRLFFFLWLLGSPASYANFTLRVYRDNITFSFVLLLFAGVLGLGLRMKRQSGRAALWSALGGVSLGCSLLLREDGWWLVPFVGAALALLVLAALYKKWSLSAFGAAALLPAAAACIVLAYCGMNFVHYGRFTVSDLSAAEFTEAYGAMTRPVISDADYNPLVPVPQSSREKLYAASPLFQTLRPYLESTEMDRWRKDCGDGLLEYSGGGFYWAVRNAASLLGHHADAEKARAFYTALAAELNAACGSGAFQALPQRSGLNSPITANRILPTLKESLRALWITATYGDLHFLPEVSVGSEQLIAQDEAFLHDSAVQLQRQPNGKSRLVLAAFGEDELLAGISLLNEAGELLPAEIGRSTGSDVYLSELFSGRDWLYANACRYTISFSGSTEGVRVRLRTQSGAEVIIPAAETAEMQSSSGIRFRVEFVGADSTEQVDYTKLQYLAAIAMRGVTLCYRLLNPLLLLFSAALMVRAFLRALREREKRGAFWCCFAAALFALAMAALRIGMVSFAEVSAFGIGTQPMYLSAVYPLLTLFCMLSAALPLLQRDET